MYSACRDTTTPWDQLISSTMTPTTAVAVKLAVTSDEPEPDVVETPCENGGLLGSIHKHLPALSKLKVNNRSEQGSPLFRYRQTRFSSRRVRRRVVFKHGDCNVVQGRVAKRRRRYLQDIFTTLVDAQWRWTLLVFALSFFLSWLGFALVWWLIVVTHNDLDLWSPTNITADAAPHHCVTNVNGFTSAFLFSVETQHTIGYGYRFTQDDCPSAIFIMCLQSITGVMIQAFMVGVVFAKLSRPKKRTQTLLFSRHAVICQRDGELCLMFRVGDMRKSHIIEAHVRAQLIKRKISHPHKNLLPLHHLTSSTHGNHTHLIHVTKEGELLPFCQTELKVGGDGEEDKIFFIWPTMIVHKITSTSPLYTLSASDMLRERFEIVVILEGVIESTGMTTQARSSYLPNEILWGHRFQQLVSFKKETGEHEVDYSLFNDTYEVDTPLCSAKELDALANQNRPGNQISHQMHHNKTYYILLPSWLFSSSGIQIQKIDLKDIQKYSETSATTPDLTSVESHSVGDCCVVQLQHVPGPESRI